VQCQGQQSASRVIAARGHLHASIVAHDRIE
jgi:hypothetical protein